MSKFNEIFAYWDDKDKAKSLRPQRNFKRSPKPKNQSQNINNNNINNSVNNNDNSNNNNNNSNINNVNNNTTTTTTTVTFTVKVENTVTTNPSVVNKYDNVSQQQLISADKTQPEPIVDEANNSSVNRYDNVSNQTTEQPSSETESNINATGSRYDNVSNNNTTTATTESSIESDNKPIGSYDNSPNQTTSTNTASKSNELLTSSESLASRYDNCTNLTLSNNTTEINSYSAYNSNNNSNGGVGSNYSMYNVNNAVGGNSSNYGSSNYNSSSLYGGSSSYSVYMANSEHGNDNDYNDYSDDYSDDDENGSDDKKKPYVERDINEEDLVLLENLIRYKSRLGMEDEISIPTPGDFINKKDQTSNDDNNAENISGYIENEDTLLSNPYISNHHHSTFPSAYSHPKFLTDKGLSNEGFSSRTIVQSSASAISNSSNNKIRLENISVTSWNSEFQRLLEMDDCLEKFERLSSLEHDFVYAAETYGRIIISENFLSNELKTIKPVSVGGIAGGEKYIVQGILFKFALENETFGLYGSDENAMKTAAHELNGCTSFLNCGIVGLHVPLMAYIDYRGFRLMAMSLLPISKKSLIYGSCDAGQTVHTSNGIFNQLFSNAAKIVNLKSHMVQDSSGDIKSIYGPIDIEGHVGSDNRFYLLDFARLSPPEPVKHRGSYLYKLLRLELVRKNSKPLCSDAFSPMSNIEIDIHNSEVKECHNHLMDVIIPEFAFNLENFFIKTTSTYITTLSETFVFEFFKNNISKYFHKEGINIRYLGEVRSYLKTDIFKNFLMVEAIVRTLKSLARELLRREMKKTHLPSDYPYRNLLLNFLNLIFDEYEGKTELFWKKIVFEKMQKKFNNILYNRGLDENTEKKITESTTTGSPNLGEDDLVNKIITNENYIIKSQDGSLEMQIESSKITLANNYMAIQTHNYYQTEYHDSEIIKVILGSKFLRFKILTLFCESIGLKLSSVAKKEFSNSSGGSFVFVDPDIVEIKTLITRLNIIDYADGMSLYYKSMAPGLSDKSKTRLLAISKERLEESLHSMSNNYNSIFQLANVIRLTAKYDSSNSFKVDKLRESEKKLKELESLRIDQNLLLLSKLHRVKVYTALSKLGSIKTTEYDEVVQTIQDCIELSPSKAYPTYLLAKFYYYYHYNLTYKLSELNFGKINESFENIFLLDENYQKGHIAYSIFLLRTQTHNPKFSAEKVSHHIIKAFSSGNLESIIEKIEPIINFNPWIVFESSKHIPKIRNMIKNAFESIVEKKGTLEIPNNVEFVESDKIFFENVNLKKLHLHKHTKAENVKVLISFFPEIEKIYLRESEIDNCVKLFSSIAKCNSLTSINLGYSKGILDENLLSIFKPTLKKIKLFELHEITEEVIKCITENCEDLEELDIGGCKNIDGDSLKPLFEKCKKLEKVAFPPTIDGQLLIELITLAPKLKVMDLMKCSKLPVDSYSNSFKFLPSLIKYRDPFGVPQFLIPKQTIHSTLNKAISMEPMLRFKIEYNGVTLELFTVKSVYGANIMHGKIYELFYNNSHPLVHFRDAPNCLGNGLFKVGHARFVDKPIPTMSVYNNPSIVGNGWSHLSFEIRLLNSLSPMQQFSFNFFGKQHQVTFNQITNHMGKTFISNVLVDLKSILYVDSQKSMGNLLSVDIRDSINPLVIFFIIATSYQK